MGYDATGQLTDWDQGVLDVDFALDNASDQRLKWTLDARGNWSELKRADAAIDTRTHNSLNTISTSTASSDIHFDAAGNLTTHKGLTLTWTADGLLKSVSKSGVTTTYYYDAMGRRAAKKVGTTLYDYAYDGWQVIYEAGNSKSISYTYGPYIDEPVSMHVSSSGSISDYYFVQGSNYNIEAMLNSSGNVVETYSLSPYGELKIFNASGTDITATGSTIGNPYVFQGRRYDKETGLYYFRNRYYSPELQRFISRDPLGYEAGDINLYRFVGNNPYGGLDPYGLLRAQGLDYAPGRRPGVKSDYTIQWDVWHDFPHKTLCKNGVCIGKQPGEEKQNKLNLTDKRKGHVEKEEKSKYNMSYEEIVLPLSCSKSVFDECIDRRLKEDVKNEDEKNNRYNILLDNCISYVDGVVKSCKKDACDN
jgi:RHS repeat-associated protein